MIMLGVVIINFYINKQTKQQKKDSNLSIEQVENGIKNMISTIKDKNDIFSLYYERANITLKTLALEEKIAQLFMVGTSTNSDFEELTRYQFGGYLWKGSKG